MAVSKRLRYEILRRDDYSCRYCGEHASPEVKLTVDHVLPTALGGTDLADNLVAACGPCNAGKSASNPDAPLVAQVSDDALRWADAVRTAMFGRLVDLDASNEYRDGMEHHWWQHQFDLCVESRWHVDLPDGWEQSVETFRVRGLPIELLNYAAAQSLGRRSVSPRNKWKYFMGTAWSILSEIESDAKRIYDRRAVANGS